MEVTRKASEATSKKYTHLENCTKDTERRTMKHQASKEVNKSLAYRLLVPNLHADIVHDVKHDVAHEHREDIVCKLRHASSPNNGHNQSDDVGDHKDRKPGLVVDLAPHQSPEVFPHWGK